MSLLAGWQVQLQNVSQMNGIRTYLHQQRENETRVVIYAKYRSGSTFASEFFLKHNKSFHVFEPLHSKNTQKVPIAILDDLFQCNISNSSYRKFISDGWYSRYAYCHPDHSQKACTERGSVDKSLSHTEQVCKGSTFKVIKVIRVDHLRDLAKFMEQGVKVIHLVRDPRGIFTSRDQLSDHSSQDSEKTFPNKVIKFCENGVDDLYFIKDFLHKKNYYLVRYEDLAFFPQKEGRLLYDFMNVEVANGLMDWIKSVEIGNKLTWNSLSLRKLRRSHPYQTSRGNSAYTSQFWREQITEGNLNTIQHFCEDFMNKLGYIALDFERVQSYSIPALQSVPKYPIRKYVPNTDIPV